MSDHNILQKAIDRAIANGWRGHTRKYKAIDEVPPHVDAPGLPSMEELIYNHDFCKAVFGDKLIRIRQTNEIPGTSYPELAMLKSWQYHLQQMVIADDPIAYLGEHLMNLDAELDEILARLAYSDGHIDAARTAGMAEAVIADAVKEPLWAQGKDRIKQLIRDVVAEITPERVSDDAMKLGGNQHDQGYNYAIDQIESNLKKILDNDKD